MFRYLGGRSWTRSWTRTRTYTCSSASSKARLRSGFCLYRRWSAKTSDNLHGCEGTFQRWASWKPSQGSVPWPLYGEITNRMMVPLVSAMWRSFQNSPSQRNKPYLVWSFLPPWAHQLPLDQVQKAPSGRERQAYSLDRIQDLPTKEPWRIKILCQQHLE